MESQAVTLLPLPTKEPQVLCVSAAGELTLHQFPRPSHGDEIVVADEGSSFVLLLRAASFVFFDLKAQREVCGTLTLRNLRPGDVAEVLCKVKTALGAQRSQPLAVRKKLPLGGVEFVQLVGNLLVHVCVFADGSTPRVAVQRWRPRQLPRAAASFSLCSKVLPKTWDVAGGPLMASVDVELQALSMAVAQSGVVRLSLQTLTEHDSQFTVEAGPLEALLTPSFGDVLDVFAGPVTMPRSPSPMRARIPPIFVASAGGIHCVLAHQVLSLALPGLSAIAPGPGKTCWHGLSCLAIAASGIHSVHLLQKDELVESKDAPEEQLNYQLVSNPIQLDASPLPGSLFSPLALVPAGTDKYLCCFSQLAVLMELRLGKLNVRAQLQVESLPRQPGVVQACCCTAWPGLEWQQLCVATGCAGALVSDSGDQVEISRLQLWQLGSAQQAQSWKLAVAGGCVFKSHSWPLDSEILADDHGDLVAVTSRSRDDTVLMVRNGQKALDEVQRLEGHSLLLRRFHRHGLMQVTEKELRIFRAGDGRSFQLSQKETLQPFCSHAAACGGDHAAVCFFAAGPVLLRKEVTLGSAPSPHSAVGLSQQISSLSACTQSPSVQLLVFASLWISHDVLLLDGTSLTELQRFPATARIHSMHAAEINTGWSLAAGTVDGQLMIWKTQGAASPRLQRYRLSRGPLHLIPGADASAMACRGSCEAFLLRRPSLEPEPLLVEKETRAIGFCSDSLLTLSNTDGGNELTLACGKLEDAQGQHSVLQSRRLRGEVLALAFKAKPKPCLLALVQHRWLRRLSLMALDDQLQLLFTAPMEESPPWPLGQPSAWLWDLGRQDVLVALGHPGKGSPPTSLHKLQLPAVRPDWRWLVPTPDGDAASRPHSGEGKVVASLRLDSPVLVAAQALEEAPIVLGNDELRFLSPETLRVCGRYALRQRLSALSLTAGRPKEWSPMAAAAAGKQMFAFLGFYNGPPQILQLKLTEGAPSCSVLRLVDGMGVISNIQRSPIYHVTPFEVDCPGEPPCGFMVWEESSGSIFELDFSSPLEAPSARRRSQASQRLNNSHWTLGQFWPKIAGGNDFACAMICQEESLRIWQAAVK